MTAKGKLNHDLKNISPVRLIVFSFFVVILIGTILLTLPISSRADTETSPVDALFIATSASCVTGLGRIGIILDKRLFFCLSKWADLV